MNKKYHIHTFGCQMNVHDSEKMAGIFSETGYEKSSGFNGADVIVLNTCSIREKAEQKFYSELGRLKTIKRDNPDIKIAVAGCIAQQKKESLFKRFPYVDFMFGPDNIGNLHKWIDNEPLDMGRKLKKTALDYNSDYHLNELPVKREGQVRAWVSIMYGCDNFCAYCIVPFTRGKERSRPSKHIYNEIKALADEGFPEITLLGQNVNSYGKNLDEEIDFAGLLYKISDIESIKRIRFVTSHPRDLSDGLIYAIRDLPNLCEHIHLPLQSGSDRVLRLMNRGYTYELYKRRIDRLREAVPDIAVTTDIIAGFPGESAEEFDQTVSALEEIRYDGIFAFKYSKRPDTKALDLPDHIEEEIKSERLARILKIQESITLEKNKDLVGKDLEVLVEGVSDSDPHKQSGRTRTNKIVNFTGKAVPPGTLLNIRIKKAQLHSLSGEIID